MNKTFLEFFAGIGLVKMGLQASDWQCVWANDNDPKKLEIYSKNFCSDDFWLGDIWECDVDQIPCSPFAATASFPCTDLSVAGDREGLKGAESGTVGAFLQLVRQMRERRDTLPVLMLENVVGLLSSHGGSDIRALIWELNQMGYVTDLIVLDAIHFVPQSRARVFIFAVDKEFAEDFFDVTSSMKDGLAFTNILGSVPGLRPKLVRQAVLGNPDLDWGLRELPLPPSMSSCLDDIIETLADDSPLWWDNEKTQRLYDQMSERHQRIVNFWRDSKTVNYGTVYRRVRPRGSMAELRSDGISGCLRTPRGGSSKQIVVRAGRGKFDVRWMTPREYGRLQGVPDSFEFGENSNKAYFGFGDAVCVPAISWLATNYLDPAYEFIVSETALPALVAAAQ